MFQKSDLTQRLYELLRTVNGTIEYETINATLGLPLDDYRAALNSARRSLEKEEKIVFAVERGVGLRRLTDQEKVWSTNQIRQSIHRKARTGSRRVDTVADFTSLPPADQITATINRTIFAVVEDQSKASSRPVTKPAAPSPVPDLARLVGG